MVLQLRVIYQSPALLYRSIINKNDQRLKTQYGGLIFTALIFVRFFIMVRKPQPQIIASFK